MGLDHGTRDAKVRCVLSSHPTAKRAISVDQTRLPLPTDVFDAAMQNYLDVHAARVRAMYNRTRAVFAEFIVAALLPGAEVAVDPAHPWDVTWRTDGREIRIQVKCSGEYLPRLPDRPSKPTWSLAPPMSTASHDCDLFVLARHTGSDIERGWEFWVLTPAAITRDNAVRPSHLEAMGAQRCPPDGLASAVRAVGCT